MLMRWLGHRSSRMVQLYYHLSDPDARRQMGRLSFVGASDADISVP
jgi:integrase